MARYPWTRDTGNAGWRCEMPGDVTLLATPDRLARGLTARPARGTSWRAQCSHWCEATRTMSRFGRDAYADLQPDAKAAMRLAEAIYEEV